MLGLLLFLAVAMTPKKYRYILFEYRLSMPSSVLCFCYCLQHNRNIFSRIHRNPIEHSAVELPSFNHLSRLWHKTWKQTISGLLPFWSHWTCVSTMGRPVFNKVESSVTKMRNVKCTKCSTNLELVCWFSLCSVALSQPSGACSLQRATCSAFIQSSRCPNPDSSTRSYCVQFWALWK